MTFEESVKISFPLSSCLASTKLCKSFKGHSNHILTVLFVPHFQPTPGPVASPGLKGKAPTFCKSPAANVSVGRNQRMPLTDWPTDLDHGYHIVTGENSFCLALDMIGFQ